MEEKELHPGIESNASMCSWGEQQRLRRRRKRSEIVQKKQQVNPNKLSHAMRAGKWKIAALRSEHDESIFSFPSTLHCNVVNEPVWRERECLRRLLPSIKWVDRPLSTLASSTVDDLNNF